MARKSPQIAEVLPLLYLHELSTSDFGPALEQFLGSGAGLSASAVTRLTAQWEDEGAAFGQRSLNDVDYVYVWVDGIHLRVRLEQTKVCLLVMMGVRIDARKELIALVVGTARTPVGETAARLQTPGHARPGAGGRRLARWCFGRRCAMCFPIPRAALLVS